jgi:hypothetical protein
MNFIPVHKKTRSFVSSVDSRQEDKIF